MSDAYYFSRRDQCEDGGSLYRAAVYENISLVGFLEAGVHRTVANYRNVCVRSVRARSAEITHNNSRFVKTLEPYKNSTRASRSNTGTMEKIAMTFPVVFWDSKTEIFGFNAEMQEGRVVKNSNIRHNIWFVNCVPVNKKKILVALVTGDLEIQMRTMTSKEKQDRVLAALRVMYPASFVKPDNVLISSWKNDPYSLGSYSNNVTKEDIKALSRSLLEGRLCFAGEATSLTRYGTMDGAYHSGRREAKRLISLFRPDSSIRRGGAGGRKRSRL